MHVCKPHNLHETYLQRKCGLLAMRLIENNTHARKTTFGFFKVEFIELFMGSMS